MVANSPKKSRIPRKPPKALKSSWTDDLWKRYVVTENDYRAAKAGCYVSEGLGEHVCDFIETYCCHAKGKWAGKPLILEDWQRHGIIMPLFSWVRPDGTRRFRTADIWVAKKNGKSTLLAAILLYLLVADGEKGAEVYTAANDREQASIIYRAAADMVRKSPKLSSQLKVRDSTKTLWHGTSTWFRALSADIPTKEGLNPSALGVDELHAFDARGAILFETLRYGGAVREQPLLFVISTAGDDDTGIGYEQYEYSKAVLKGDIESTAHFAFITEADKDGDPSDEEQWRKANPMFGITIKPDELREAYEASKGSPRKTASFRRYRMNVWVNAADPWLDMARWADCGGDVEWDQFDGAIAGAGLDLASSRDMCSLALTFTPDGGDGLHYTRWWNWLPLADIAERERKNGLPYRQWAEEGWLTLTDGNTADHAFIRKQILELNEQYQVQWHYDPWSAKTLMEGLQNDEGLNVVPVRQGVASMSAPSKRWDCLVSDGKLRHGDNPIARTQASLVTTRQDENGNIMPRKSEGTKKSARRFQIDMMIAGILSVDAIMNMEDDVSPYAKTGILYA